MSRIQKEPLRRLTESERGKLERLSRSETAPAAQVRRPRAHHSRMRPRLLVSGLVTQ